MRRASTHYDYASAPLHMVEGDDSIFTRASRAGEAGFLALAWRCESANRVSVRFVGTSLKPYAEIALTRTEIEALHVMLGEVLDDWRA